MILNSDISIFVINLLTITESEINNIQEKKRFKRYKKLFEKKGDLKSLKLYLSNMLKNKKISQETKKILNILTFSIFINTEGY